MPEPIEMPQKQFAEQFHDLGLQLNAAQEKITELNNQVTDANIRVSVVTQKLSEVETANVELRIMATKLNIQISQLTEGK